MNVLLIAPSAPPKNSPEALQVYRFLTHLESDVRVLLATTPVVAGWEWFDPTLAIDRAGFERIELALPAHRFLHRLLSHRYLSWLRLPDEYFWLPAKAAALARLARARGVEVIYSRSFPLSAALLGRAVKRRLDLPWLMHLSDPWVGNPYRRPRRLTASWDLRLEGACFADADAVSFTTERQLAFYAKRYPQHAHKFLLAPNMMPARASPLAASAARRKESAGRLRIVYAGSLYGERNPATLFAAIDLLLKRTSRLADRLAVDFYGTAEAHYRRAIESAPCCRWHGVVTSTEATRIQAEADLLLVIEPPASHPLSGAFLLSKVVDCLAAGRPMLAITPRDSETWRLCRAGAGWAVEPGDVATLADLLGRLAARKEAGEALPTPPESLAEALAAPAVTRQILASLRRLRDGR
ncbi:MAG: hypothetical protein KatS3mg124_0784 [Porticoccaceae bacterium]|nr:MAG: hypothetical protein KatS3mg124_0784 [Porticoccaceae bacterium]